MRRAPRFPWHLVVIAVALAAAVLGPVIVLSTHSAPSHGAVQATRQAAPAAKVVIHVQTAADLAEALQLTSEHGYVSYTATTDPNHLLGRATGYSSKVNWGDPAEVGLWGSIEVFPQHYQAVTRAGLVSSMAPPLGDGYDYQAGNALLRLGAQYTPSQAQALAVLFENAVDQ